jgi:hypothetical protein
MPLDKSATPSHYAVEGHYPVGSGKREWKTWVNDIQTLETAVGTVQNGLKLASNDGIGFDSLRIVAVYIEVIE